MADLLLQGFSVAGISRCHLRHSRRARRMRIELRPDRSLLVVIPTGTREDQWLKFVLSKTNWIVRNLQKYPAQHAPRPDLEGCFPSAIELRCSGQTLQVSRSCGRLKKTILQGDCLELVCPTTDTQQGYQLLRRWLVARAREEFTARLEMISVATGFAWKKLSIRGQKTRWGSCSASRDISLNFKLLFLPTELVDHILLHELVHTQEMNHSPQFWALMNKFDADCSRHRRELRSAGRLLPGWLVNI